MWQLSILPKFLAMSKSSYGQCRIFPNTIFPTIFCDLLIITDNRGCIIESKGHKVNCIKVIIVTTQEKTWWMSSCSLPKGPSDKSNCNDGSKQPFCFGTFHQPSYWAWDAYTIGFGKSILTTRPTIMEEIKDVEKLLDFKNDLQKIGEASLKQLEDQK